MQKKKNVYIFSARLKPDFSTSTTKFLIEANHIPDENRIYPPNYPVTIMIEYPTYNYNDDNTKSNKVPLTKLEIYQISHFTILASTRPPLRRPNISTKPPTKSTTSSMIVFPDEYSKMKEKNENSLQNNNEILSSMINSS